MNKGVANNFVAVACLLTDERLEFASTSRVTGKVVVGLKTDFTRERRLNFTLVRAVPGGECVSLPVFVSRVINGFLPWEQSTTKNGLNKELRVETSWGGIEGGSWDSWIDKVCGSNSVTKIGQR